MEKRERLSGSSALKTNEIWSKTIGYDPYASNIDKKDEDNTKDEQVASFMLLAKMSKAAQGNNTTGACKRCGMLGHLTFQCRNSIQTSNNEANNDSVSDSDSDDDINIDNAAAKHNSNKRHRDSDSTSDSDTSDSSDGSKNSNKKQKHDNDEKKSKHKHKKSKHKKSKHKHKKEKKDKKDKKEKKH